MVKILPHTKRFNLIFNKLKAEKKLPSNAILAIEIGLNSGNSLTEIKNERQNIGLESIKLFCEKYEADYEYIIGKENSSENKKISIEVNKFKFPQWQKN